MRRELHPIEVADIRIALATAPVEETRVGRLIGRLGDLGDQPPMIGVSLAVAAAGMWRRDRRQAAAGVRMLAALALATGLKNLIKQRINRSRPVLLIEHGHYEAQPGTSADKTIKSFPSGHTAGMIAIAAAASRAYPAHGGLAFLPATVFSLIQVPRRSHFVSDVVAGAAIGLLAEAIVARAWPRRHASTGTKRVHRPY